MLQRKSNQAVRELNRSTVLRAIAQRSPIARFQLARLLGLSPATVTALTRELIDSGVVQVVEQAPSRGGRPALLLGLVPQAATAIGVKVASDHIAGVRVDLEGEIVERFEERFDPAARDAVPWLQQWLRQKITDDGGLVLGVGIGVPGLVTGVGVVESPMAGWHGVPLAGLLAPALHVPVLIDNDVNTLAVFECLYGRGRDRENFLIVTLGRGVGLGIVAGGSLHRGAHGGAGELGHTTVLEDGPLCECGKRGCLEALVGDAALVGAGRRAGLLSARDGIAELVHLAGKGSPPALEIFAAAGAVLGRSVANIVSVFDPEVVLLSGEGTRAWQHLDTAFRHNLDLAVFPPLRGVELDIASWDETAWARGAAALVLKAPLAPSSVDVTAEREVRARLAGSTAGAAA